MQIFRVQNWLSKNKEQTWPGPWCGIAIAPDSDEGRIIVNGITLQAGRVLPLRTGGQSYTIERAVARSGGPDDIATAVTSAKELSVMLFESGDELAAEVARPHGRYFGSIAAAEAPAVAGLVRFPLTGRVGFHAVLHPENTNAELGYRLIGRRFVQSLGLMTSVTLADVAPGSIQAGPAVINTLEESNGECWDEFQISVSSNPPGVVVHAEVDTIGESGR